MFLLRRLCTEVLLQEKDSRWSTPRKAAVCQQCKNRKKCVGLWVSPISDLSLTITMKSCDHVHLTANASDHISYFGNVSDGIPRNTLMFSWIDLRLNRCEKPLKSLPAAPASTKVSSLIVTVGRPSVGVCLVVSFNSKQPCPPCLLVLSLSIHQHSQVVVPFVLHQSSITHHTPTTTISTTVLLLRLRTHRPPIIMPGILLNSVRRASPKSSRTNIYTKKSSSSSSSSHSSSSLTWALWGTPTTTKSTPSVPSSSSHPSSPTSARGDHRLLQQHSQHHQQQQRRYSTGGKNTSTTSRHASLWGTEIPCEHGEKWGHFIDLDHPVEESE